MNLPHPFIIDSLDKESNYNLTDNRSVRHFLIPSGFFLSNVCLVIRSLILKLSMMR